MTETILKKLGVDELNEMQKETYDGILRSKSNVILLSPTGSGKTLAYLLPLVQLLDAMLQKVLLQEEQTVA